MHENSNKESKATVRTSCAFVVQPDGEGTWLLFDANGDMAVARSHEELGRHALQSLRDPAVPRVEVGRPGGGRAVVALSRALDQLVGPGGDEGEPTAVQVVLYLASGGERPDVVVWPSVGKPRTAGGELELGERLAAIAADETQPRIAAGAPPDPGGDLMDRGMAAAAALIPGIFGG